MFVTVLKIKVNVLSSHLNMCDTRSQPPTFYLSPSQCRFSLGLTPPAKKIQGSPLHQDTNTHSPSCVGQEAGQGVWYTGRYSLLRQGIVSVMCGPCTVTQKLTVTVLVPRIHYTWQVRGIVGSSVRPQFMVAFEHLSDERCINFCSIEGYFTCVLRQVCGAYRTASHSYLQLSIQN